MQHTSPFTPTTQSSHIPIVIPSLPFFSPNSEPSQSLPQPIPQLRLPELRQVVHALLTQINALQLRHILRRRLANPLHDDRRVRLENYPIIDNLVNRQRDQIIVLDNRSFID